MSRRLSLLVLLLPALALADTTWVTDSQVRGDWQAEHSPYMIGGSIWIESGDSLRIWPGVHVRFLTMALFTVNGSLDILGTETGDVNIGHDSATNHQGWMGITVQSPDSIALIASYCHLYQKADGGTGQGAALRLIDSRALLYDCRISGTFQCVNMQRSSVELTNCELLGNRLMDASQGIRSWELCSLTLTGCTLSDFHIIDGPALMLNQTATEITDCVFRNNNGGVWGGAIYADGSSRLTVSGTSFLENEARLGGALYVVSGENDPCAMSFERCVFYHNGDSDTYTGGAIYTSCPLSLSNCTFAANHANDACAVRGAGQLAVTSCSFYDHDQGPLFGSVLPLVLRYSLFFENANADLIPDWPEFGLLDRVNSSGDSCDRYYNIFFDPLLADTSSQDFHLTAASPCIDAGDSTLPRDPDGSLADIGAFRYDVQPASPGSPVASSAELPLIAYPNPFNATTELEFKIEQPRHVELSVIDITGRRVATLLNSNLDSGPHRLRFDGSNLATGIYFASLRTGPDLTVRKLLLLK